MVKKYHTTKPKLKTSLWAILYYYGLFSVYITQKYKNYYKIHFLHGIFIFTLFQTYQQYHKWQCLYDNMISDVFLHKSYQHN